jgi:hypothetical protein
MGKSKSQEGESGIDELRRAANVSGWCRESAYDGFTAEECLNMLRACWASGWDMLPDMLTLTERSFAARNGKVSAACAKRLERDLGGGDAEVVR